MFTYDEHLPGLMALNEILGGRCASCDRLRGPHGPGRRVECIRALFNKALMFRTFEAQHARAMQNQLRMCVVEKETSLKMFFQTETTVSPAWSSDELSPQKANASTFPTRLALLNKIQLRRMRLINKFLSPKCAHGLGDVDTYFF